MPKIFQRYSKCQATIGLRHQWAFNSLQGYAHAYRKTHHMGPASSRMLANPNPLCPQPLPSPRRPRKGREECISQPAHQEQRALQHLALRTGQLHHRKYKLRSALALMAFTSDDETIEFCQFDDVLETSKCVVL
jgi:hypothetical protein